MAYVSRLQILAITSPSMKTHNPERPGRPSPTEVVQHWDSELKAVPEVIDEERILHAYKQGYKTEGTLRNSKPTTAEEKALADAALVSFKDHIFSLPGNDSPQAASGIFCHHVKIRVNNEGQKVTFLSEIRDERGRSLIPCDEDRWLIPCEHGLVAVQVNATANQNLQYIPLYSPQAFQREIDACSNLTPRAPGNYLGWEILRAAGAQLEDRNGVIREALNIQAKVADSSAQFQIDTLRGSCLVCVSHDPKTLRVRFEAFLLE